MAKKMYISPLFSGGLVDGGDHTEPYSNSQGTFSPDTPTNTLPDMSALGPEQMANVMSLPLSQINAMAGEDGIISLEEYLTVFPEPAPAAPASGDPE